MDNTKDKKFSYLPGSKTVVVAASGTYNLKFEAPTVQKVGELLRKHDSVRCLFDLSKANIELEILDICMRPSVYQMAGLDYATRIAVVSYAYDPDLLFYETYCLNDGWTVHLFHSRKNAVKWLTEDDHPESES